MLSFGCCKLFLATQYYSAAVFINSILAAVGKVQISLHFFIHRTMFFPVFFVLIILFISLDKFLRCLSLNVYALSAIRGSNHFKKSLALLIKVPFFRRLIIKARQKLFTTTSRLQSVRLYFFEQTNTTV